MSGRPTPLEPERFFLDPWDGEGELQLRGLLGRLRSGRRRFRFRSSTTMLSERFWIVHDEMRWENGRTEFRDGLCRRSDKNTLRMTYDDVLGGAEVQLRADGFTIGPYTLMVPLARGAVRMPLRCRDQCRVRADGALVDTIDLSVGRWPVGQLTMCLWPTADEDESHLRTGSDLEEGFGALSGTYPPDYLARLDTRQAMEP